MERKYIRHFKGYLLGENLYPIVHLISKSFDVTQGRVFCLENRLVRDIEIQQTLLSEVVPTEQFLSFFFKDLG